MSISRRSRAKVRSIARGALIERRGRLVEQQHSRLLCEGAGQHRALLLTDREGGDIAIGELGFETGEGEAARGVRLPSGQPGGELEVRAEAPLEQGG